MPMEKNSFKGQLQLYLQSLVLGLYKSKKKNAQSIRSLYTRWSQCHGVQVI